MDGQLWNCFLYLTCQIDLEVKFGTTAVDAPRYPPQDLTDSLWDITLCLVRIELTNG